MKVDVALKSRHLKWELCDFRWSTWLLRLYILVKRFCLSGQQQGLSHFYSSVLIYHKTSFNYSEYISQRLSFGTRMGRKKTGISNEHSCSWEFWAQRCLASEENPAASPHLWNKTCWFILLTPVWGQLKLARWCRHHVMAMAGPRIVTAVVTRHVGVMPTGVCLHCFLSNVLLSSRLSLSVDTCHYCFITVSISKSIFKSVSQCFPSPACFPILKTLSRVIFIEIIFGVWLMLQRKSHPGIAAREALQL